MRGRNRVRVTDAEFIELAEQRRFGHAFSLVGRQQHLLLLRAQVASDVVILCRQATANVDDEDHRVGLGHRLARLLGHFGDDATGFVGLEAAGVDDDELAAVQLCIAVVPVAREPGEIGDDGIAALRDSVEQRRLADVGPSDERDHGLHRQCLNSDERRRARPCAWSRVPWCRPPPACRRWPSRRSASAAAPRLWRPRGSARNPRRRRISRSR